MKISKITLMLFLVITIFCILFVRIIPDYSNDYGYKIVTLNDYKKYKLGYCLKEDRVLSKDELYKRAAIDYLKKKQIVDEMLLDKYCKVYGYNDNSCNYGDNKLAVEIGFYQINGLNSDNWVKVINSLYSRYDKNNIRYPLRKSFIDDEILQKYNGLYENIILDKNIVKFKQPVIYYTGTSKYLLFLNNAFFIGDMKIQLAYPIYIGEWKIKKIEKTKYEEYFIKNNSGYYQICEIDVCGNSKYEIKKTYKIKKDSIGKGG